MDKALKIEINASELNDHQKRLIKGINSLLEHILVTSSEEEYFESSSELMRLVATAIKKSNFNKQCSSIEFDQQVLEFCVDTLSDQVYERNVETLDN